jgi:hypothetical protein
LKGEEHVVVEMYMLALRVIVSVREGSRAALRIFVTVFVWSRACRLGVMTEAARFASAYVAVVMRCVTYATHVT